MSFCAPSDTPLPYVLSNISTISTIRWPSANTLPRYRARPLAAKRAGPAPVRQGWRVPRPPLRGYGLDRPSLPRQRLAKRSRLKMSETAPSLDRSKRNRARQVFTAGNAQRAINRFRKPASYRILAGCLTLATDGPDASGSGFHPTTFGITLTRRNVVRAGRPGTTCRTGRSRMIGPNAFRSRTPRWTCSRHGSATCSMNCSGRAGDRKREHPP